MKNLQIIIALLGMLVCSCSSPEQKLIKKHIQTYLPDVQSYESIELSESRPYLSKLEENIAFNDLKHELDSLKKIVGNRLSDVAYLGNLDFNDKKYGQSRKDIYIAALADWLNVTKGIKSAEHQIDSIKQNYKPSQIGYEITHKFRAKNSNGGYVIEEYYFVTDMEKMKLIKVFPCDTQIQISFPSIIYFDPVALGM